MSLAVESFWSRLFNTRMRDLVRGRINGSLGWRAVIARGGLPAELAGVVEQVVHKSRLWKRERVEVAEELIAHFADGLDTGAPVERLVESFGEQQQAAKLIRRAKRRCRPLWWQAWWWASRSVLALLVVYGLMALWLRGVRPEISTNYLVALNADAASAGINDRAWPLYLEALEIVYGEVRRETENPSEGDAPAPDHGWVDALIDGGGEEVTPEVVAWLDAHQEFLAKLRAAAARPKLGVVLGPGEQYLRDFAALQGKPFERDASYDDEDGMILCIVLPHVQELRYLSAPLRLDALHAAREGDGPRALANIEALLGVANHAGENAFFVGGVVKVGLMKSACRLVERLIAEHNELWTPEQLARLAHRIATVEFDQQAWMQMERWAFLDTVQRTYSDDGSGDGFLTSRGLQLIQEALIPLTGTTNNQNLVESPLFLTASAPALRFGAPSRRETIAKFDELLALAVTDQQTPLWRWPSRFGDFSERISAMSQVERIRYALVTLLMPAFTASVSESAGGHQDGVLIGLALELYRRENGEWPASLDELSPRWLPETPVDRINGGPLKYLIVEGQPLVYSRGVDGADDGGRLPLGCQGDATKYRVGAPRRTPITADTPSRVTDNEQGDWVVWSLVRE